MHRPRYLI